MPLKIKSLSDLQKFPIINKEIYFNLNKKKSVKIDKNIYLIKAMANIDGEEALFPLSLNDYQNYIDFEKRKFELAGVKKSDLCSVVEFSQNSTIVQAQSILALGASYVPLDGDEAKIFQDIVRYKVSVIFTIPPVVYRLMEYVKVRKLKTSLRLIITTGVKIPDVNKLNLETKDVLGAELIDTIGATELASFAFSCKKHRNFYHFIDQKQIVEIIDPVTKQPANEGEIVITPLWKVDFPLIRYGTDIFTKLDKHLKCDCSVKNKTFFSGVEKRLTQATRIQRYLVDLKDFYYQVKDSLIWQNFFDKRLWFFIEKPILTILITRIKNVDTVLVFIDKAKFRSTMRRRQPIEESIFKMTNSDTRIILCNKKIIEKMSPSYQDIRDISKKYLPKEIKDLLSLC
jgi:phenylacetate-coenzyme A ligase PaaK-like adenylate-forming protein